MADEKTRALTGPRQLKAMMSEYVGAYEENVGFNNYKNWQSFALPNQTEKICVFSVVRTDVNLSLDRLTFFPESCFLQDPGVYYRTPSFDLDTVNDLLVIDLISVKELDVPLISFNMNANIAAGMLGSKDDFNQIIMGSFRLFAQNQNFVSGSNIQTLMHQDDFSSASPFAQDSLWYYRILIPRSSNYNGATLLAPSSRFIVQGVIGQEDEIPYMMRLKNSYELQQQA